MAADETDQLLFIVVPPPSSGGLVDDLTTIPNVIAAAAVYSGVDVVAHLRGSAPDLADARYRIKNSGAPIQGKPVLFDVAQTYQGPRYNDLTFRSPNSCHAYIRCRVDTKAGSPDYAARALARLDCTVSVYRSIKETDLIVEVLAPNKRSFDSAVMSKVQSEWRRILSTRTYLVTNTIGWRTDWDPKTKTPTLFMGYSHHDDHFVRRLRDQIQQDTGLYCWRDRDDLNIGGSNWPNSVDHAMKLAPLHLYILTEASIRSPECQREFGQSLGIVRHPEDICCFVTSSALFDDDEFSTRYDMRNCLRGDDLYSYTELLQWVQVRLAEN